MARLARIVLPGIARHVTQRGNRRQPVFFSEEDYAAYVEQVSAVCAEQAVRCLAWCLMPNHVHLILIPATEDGLRSALGEAHRRYSRRKSDGFTDLDALAGVQGNWRAMLHHGLDAGDASAEGEAAIAKCLLTGRPLGDTLFVEKLEQATGRMLKPRKPGPKPRQDN